jgi:hypothetical protein
MLAQSANTVSHYPSSPFIRKEDGRSTTTPRTIENSIEIPARPEEVWKVLTATDEYAD